MPKFYGYIRVSTAAQANDGMSLEAHTMWLKQYFDGVFLPSGFEWGGIVVDPGVSGMIEFSTRKAGSQLNTTTRRGDIIAVVRLDRIFRNLLDCLSTVRGWTERGVGFASINEGFDFTSPVGELIMRVIVAVAEFEWHLKSQRILDVNTAKKAIGDRPGGVHAPVFFRWVRSRFKTGPKWKLVPDEKDRALGNQIVQWKDEGYSWFDIRNALRKAGIQRKGYRRFADFKFMNPKFADYWSTSTITEWHHSMLKLRFFIAHEIEPIREHFSHKVRQDYSFYIEWHHHGEPILHQYMRSPDMPL